MRILVTGGAGYIGSITTRALCDRGHDVRVIDTLEKGHKWAVDSRAKLYEGSIADKPLVEQALDGVDAVMHLAGYIEVGESMKDPQRYFSNNVDNGHVLLEQCHKAGVKNFVFSSTAAVYGQPKIIPVSENDELAPINPYGESKRQFELLLDEYAEQGIRSIRFRYFNVAGAWPDGSLGEAHSPETHLIPNVIRALMSGDKVHIFGQNYPTKDGTCVRDYIHVCDLAQAHIYALEALGGGEQGGIYNLGNGQGFSNLEIVTACCEALGIDAATRKACVIMDPPREGDPATLVASSTRARERFGWEPRYATIDEIVSHACAWHKAHEKTN